MEINLKNKTAWVFGGSKGIGKAVAIGLANAGASVLLIARNTNSLHKTLNCLCTNQDQEHDTLSVDMSNSESLINNLKNYRNLKNVDIVINNSGGPPPGLAHTASIEEYSIAFSQHVLAAQAATQMAVPEMKRKQFGRIINIISTSVKQPIVGLGVSNTIRGAMGNWSKSLSFELGKFGITVNNVLPGATMTDRLDDLIQKVATKKNCSPENVAEKMKGNIPLGRFAKPEEISFLVTFLCSRQSSYINGINIPIDGGRTKSL